MVYVIKQLESLCGEVIFIRCAEVGPDSYYAKIQYFHNLYNLTVTIDIIDHKLIILYLRNIVLGFG